MILKTKHNKKPNAVIIFIPSSTSRPTLQPCCSSCLAVCLDQVPGAGHSIYPSLTQTHSFCSFWAFSISQLWCLGIFLFGIELVLSQLALSTNSICSLKKKKHRNIIWLGVLPSPAVLQALHPEQIRGKQTREPPRWERPSLVTRAWLVSAVWARRDWSLAMHTCVSSHWSLDCKGGQSSRDCLH